MDFAREMLFVKLQYAAMMDTNMIDKLMSV